MVNKKELLGILEKEYREKYGSIEKVRKFFNTFISKDDKNCILEKYKNGKYNKIEKVLSEIYTMRSKFVHNLGFEKLFPSDAVLEVVKDDSSKTGDILELQITLNIEDLIIIIWVGILRKFGFSEKRLKVI